MSSKQKRIKKFSTKFQKKCKKTDFYSHELLMATINLFNLTKFTTISPLRSVPLSKIAANFLFPHFEKCLNNNQNIKEQ